MDKSDPSLGDMLRQWRERRRMSQLALALEVEISPRHMSFVETGRSRPSQSLLLRLADQLRLPLREQNALQMAAGYAPKFPERPLSSPDMRETLGLIDRYLTAHEPNPALALGRDWTILAMNRAVALLVRDVDPLLLQGEVNALRLTLHPQGLAPKILNLAEWRDHNLRRLQHDIDLSADPRLVSLHDELAGYPVPRSRPSPRTATSKSVIAIPMVLSTPEGTLSFLSATTVFGTAVDVTLSEIVVETFLPADQATANVLRNFAATYSAN